jgi:hypothetical protein
MSDVDDHTYSVTTPKVYFEEVEPTTSYQGKAGDEL